MKNNKLKASFVVLALFSLSLNSVIAKSGFFGVARNDSGDVFLYGDHIEVGIASNGAFGSLGKSPKGISYQKALGYISDPSYSNFKKGYHGDFFLTLVAEEGWAISINDTIYNNNRNLQDAEIPKIGAIALDNTDSTATAVWKGRIEGLEITQTFRIYKIGLAIIIDVSLKNTTSSIMRDVYYMRTVDPDNNSQQSKDTVKSYVTVNTIMRQGDQKGGAAVTAEQSIISNADNEVTRTTPSLLGLCGHGSNSRAAHGGTGAKYSAFYRDPKEVYNTTQKAGDSAEEDQPIAIAFKFDQIFPEQTVKFRAGYQLADITPATIDIDKDNSSGAQGNSFKTVYTLGDVAKKITDSDIFIQGLQDDLIVAASIKINNADVGDKLIIEGALPQGIRLDNEEENNDTVIHLISEGEIDKNAYQQVLQQIKFENEITTSHTETRHIAIIVLDSNYTASTAADSIIEVVTPVTLNDDRITLDNKINHEEQDSISLSGTAAANIEVKIIFTDKEGNKVIETVTSDEHGFWTLDNNPVDLSSLADGVISVDIISVDANGNSSTYSINSLKDSEISLSIDSPKAGEIASSTHPIITGKSDPNADIVLQFSNTKSYTTQSDEAGNWSYTLPEQALGSTLTVTVTAKDEAGNEISQVFSFEIPSIPLQITDVELSTTPTFSGTSTPSTTLTISVPTTDGNVETCTTITDANGHWSCQLSTLPSGDTTATITTTDDNGNSTSQTYDMTIPEISLVIDSPVDHDQLSDSSPRVSGTSHPNTTLTVTAAGEECSTTADETGRWECELPVLPLDSELVLTVESKDEAGNTATETITITTPNILLEIKTVDISTSPTFSGMSTPDMKITVNVPLNATDSEICTTTSDADGLWSCTLPILPSNEVYTATVKAEDKEGSYATDTQVLTTPKLFVSVDSHADDAILTDATPTIAGTSSLGTTLILTASTGQTCTTKTDATGHWSCPLLELPLSEVITLLIQTKDDIGNTSTKTITLTTPALPVSLTKIEASTTPTIRGTSIPDTHISVTLPINDTTTKSCSAITDKEGNWFCQMPPLPTTATDAAPYTLTVIATDDKGNSASLTEEFKVPKLALVVNNPTNNAVISEETPQVSGTSTPNSSVTVSSSTGESCTTTTNSNNHWSCQLTTLALGVNIELVITVEDSAGNQSTEAIEISTNKLPLDIISPSDKETASDSTPDFIGTTKAGSTITVTAESGQDCKTVADDNGNWHCELSQFPVGGPYTLIITAEDGNGNSTEIVETIFIPEIPLIITSPLEGETIKGRNFTVTGTTDPNTAITVLGTDGEKCTTTSDHEGHWRCLLENLQAGNEKYLTVISGDKEEGQKIALVRINIKNSTEKVSTILKGGAGGLSLWGLFLLSLIRLLKMMQSTTAIRFLQKNR